jgi:hypothetical protein
MKIVKQGTKPKRFPWIGRWSCVYCHSVIELDESDEALKPEWHDDQRDGESVRVRCPVCEEVRWLSAA